MATATLTKASDSNLEIPEGRYTDDSMVTTVTLSRAEISNMTEKHFDSGTVTKTNVNATEIQITTSTKNYNNTVFGVTQITHGVTADQHPSTVPAINEETSAVPIGTIICITIAVLVLIGVCVGMPIRRCKHKYRKVQTDPEGEHQDESNDKKSLFNSPCFSFITTNK
jgi:hypothetical protein